MDHYYTDDTQNVKSKEKTTHAIIAGKSYHFLTDHGVFSKAGLDYGTRVLLDALTDGVKKETLLDLGCGYGPIGIVLGDRWNVEPDMCDINSRALGLAKRNLDKNNVKGRVFKSDGFDRVEGSYDAIVTNPPIRAGKKTIYGWFEKAKRHLTDEGALYFVINKKQGAPSARRFCEKNYNHVDVIAKKSGYHVIKCRN